MASCVVSCRSVLLVLTVMVGTIGCDAYPSLFTPSFSLVIIDAGNLTELYGCLCGNDSSECHLNLTTSGHSNGHPFLNYYLVTNVVTTKEAGQKKAYVCQPLETGTESQSINCSRTSDCQGQGCQNLQINETCDVRWSWPNLRYFVVASEDLPHQTGDKCDVTESEPARRPGQDTDQDTDNDTSSDSSTGLGVSLGVVLCLVAAIAVVFGVLYWRRKSNKPEPLKALEKPDFGHDKTRPRDAEMEGSHYVKMKTSTLARDPAHSQSACAGDDVYDATSPTAGNDDVYEAASPTAAGDDDVYEAPRPAAAGDDDVYEVASPRPASEFVYTSLVDNQAADATYGNMFEIPEVKVERDEEESTYNNF